MADGITADEKAERCALAACPLAGQGDARCACCTGPVAWKDARGVRHGRARSCHGCPMDGLGLPVCWAACPGPNDGFSTDGQSMVTLGGMAGQDGADAFVGNRMSVDAHIARMPSADFYTRLAPEAETAVMELVRIFVGMTDAEVLNLHAYMRAGGFAGAGRLRGVSKQAVNQCAARIVRKFPKLASFFAVGAGRAQARDERRETRKAARQT